jgi:hypothetical protein
MNEQIKYYGKFAPIERINLLIAAMVREDASECRELLDWCPKGMYYSLDPAYAKMINRLTMIASCFAHYYAKNLAYFNSSTIVAALLNYCKIDFENVETFCNAIFTNGLVDGEIKHKKSGIPCGAKKHFLELSTSFQTKIASLFEALRCFCETVGLDYKMILNFLARFMKDETLLAEQSMHAAIKVDAEVVEMQKQAFLELWEA